MKVVINYKNACFSLIYKVFDIDFHYQGGFRWSILIEKMLV